MIGTAEDGRPSIGTQQEEKKMCLFRRKKRNNYSYTKEIYDNTNLSRKEAAQRAIRARRRGLSSTEAAYFARKGWDI